MKTLSIVFYCILSAGICSAANATVKGRIDAIFLENNHWTLAGWACRVGTSQNTTVSFWAGSGQSTYLGNITANLTSEPEVAATCSSSSTSLRFKFSISDSDLSSIANTTIYAETTASGETATLVNSSAFKVPTNYTNDPYSDIESASKILFIGAHPDDDMMATIFFNFLCYETNISCGIAIATLGNNSTRAAELASAATFMNYDYVVHDSLSSADGPDVSDVLDQWADDINETNAYEWAKDIIVDYAPDYIITFDPRTGVSCHLDHRAIGEMVIDAANAISFNTSKVLLASQLLKYQPTSGTNPHPEMSLWRTDATDTKYWSYSGDTIIANTPSGYYTGWDMLLDMAAIYSSQFTAAQVDKMKPLHLSSIGLPYTQWVGNDVTGRLPTLLRLSDYSPTEQPFASICN